MYEKDKSEEQKKRVAEEMVHPTDIGLGYSGTDEKKKTDGGDIQHLD